MRKTARALIVAAGVLALGVGLAAPCEAHSLLGDGFDSIGEPPCPRPASTGTGCLELVVAMVLGLAYLAFADWAFRRSSHHSFPRRKPRRRREDEG